MIHATPAEKHGLKVGDEVTVIRADNNKYVNDGVTLILKRDDGSSSPWFTVKHPRDIVEGINPVALDLGTNDCKFVKKETHMNTKKQEALDQIAALQKFVEELDTTPEETPVRVYIKKDATATKYYTYKKSMTGGVFDMNDSNYTEDVYTIWQDDEHSDYWMFNKSDCVVVEGKV